MKLSFFKIGSFVIGLTLAVGCAKDDEKPSSGSVDASSTSNGPGVTGSGGSSPSGSGGTSMGKGGSGAGGSTAGSGGSTGAGGAKADAGGPTTASVTYEDVKPLFMAKCAPCHTTLSSGKQNIAANYTDALKDATSTTGGAACMGKKVGECAAILVRSKKMPLGGTLTEDQIVMIESWAKGGLKEK